MNFFYESRLGRLQTLTPELDYSGVNTTVVYDRRAIFAKGKNILLVGEAPGKNEVLNGIPFCGQAGKNLSKLISISQIPRETFCITNGFCFRTFKSGSKGVINRTPSPKELSAGALLLAEEIKLLEPKAIILLGGSASKAFSYLDDKSLFNSLKSATKHSVVQVYSDILGKHIHFAQTFHPSPLVFNQPQKREILEQFFERMSQCF